MNRMRLVYEVMFSLRLGVHFGADSTPPAQQFAFSQILELFRGLGPRAEVMSELFWANLHGVAKLTRTKRFPPGRRKERWRELVEVFERLI